VWHSFGCRDTAQLPLCAQACSSQHDETFLKRGEKRWLYTFNSWRNNWPLPFLQKVMLHSFVCRQAGLTFDLRKILRSIYGPWTSRRSQRDRVGQRLVFVRRSSANEKSFILCRSLKYSFIIAWIDCAMNSRRIAIALLAWCLGTFGYLAAGDEPVNSSASLALLHSRDRALGTFTVNSTGSESVNGCECLSQCDVSFDSLIPWCLTSASGVPRDEVIDPCGRYSTRRAAFWDECIVNVTSSDFLATTFDGMCGMQCHGRPAACTLPRRAIQPHGAHMHDHNNVGVLPGQHAINIQHVQRHKASLVDTGTLCFVGGDLISGVFVNCMWVAFCARRCFQKHTHVYIFAAMFLSQVYLSMPYAIPRSFAVALGVAQAAVVIYWQFARSFNPNTA